MEVETRLKSRQAKTQKQMKNKFTGSIQKFKAPNQPTRENLAGSRSHVAKIHQRDVIEKIKPFEAKFRAAKFTESLFAKNNLELQRAFKKVRAVEKREEAEMPENNILMD